MRIITFFSKIYSFILKLENQRFPSAGSLPKWQQLELDQANARNFFQYSYVGGRAQALGPCSMGFPGVLPVDWIATGAAIL